MKTTSLFVPVLTAALVHAHGFLKTVTINGQAYNGNVPLAVDNPSIIRQVVTPFPNKGASNPALTCGPNSTAAALVANANPGDSLTFSWESAALGNWPHDTGPMMTYLANCGSVPCEDFDITQAKWFKIQEIGRTSPGSAWAQATLMNGGVATASLPRTLAAGNYLLRHEIIALHLATSLGGAEFYPGCAQIRVGGSETGSPSPDELVSIPGAYRDDDPGIFDTQIFNTSALYVFPGPPIASFVGATTSGTSTSPSGNSSTLNPSSSTILPTTTSKTSSKSCRIKKASAATPMVQPRHFSRIMGQVRSWH